MTYKASFDKKLQIASLESKPDWHRLKVHTLLQNTKQKQPSINAYLGARYSRSADSIKDIAAEIMNTKTDAAKRLETIFQGYGHKSVGDMAQVFICIENAPMFQVQKLFYMNPVHAGQERSTRFQNFEAPNFIKLPKKTNKVVREKYEKIFNQWMQNYRELLEPTKQALIDRFKPDKSDKMHMGALQARSFDTVRGFLPIGLETSFALVMSARSWAELIGYLRASNQLIDKELGEILFSLLTQNKELIEQGYIPEVDGLIRHTDANLTRENSTEEILKLIKSETRKLPRLKVKPEMSANAKASLKSDAIQTIIQNYALILDPMADVSKLKISEEKLSRIGKIIAKYHNQHNQIGPAAQSGAILLEGFGDYGGVLKDINRHRSLERYFPLFSNQLSIKNELKRPEKECYFLYEYLQIKDLKKLKAEYVKRFNSAYKEVKAWMNLASKELPQEQVLEYTRYLLPHGHASKYKLFGALDDWQYLVNLRTRNGGHIAYRELSHKWLKKLAKASPIFQPTLDKIPEVNYASREQFFDRS